MSFTHPFKRWLLSEEHSPRTPTADAEVNTSHPEGTDNVTGDPGCHSVFPKHLITQYWTSNIHLVVSVYHGPWEDKYYSVLFESLLLVSTARGLIFIINKVFPWNI